MLLFQQTSTSEARIEVDGNAAKVNWVTCGTAKLLVVATGDPKLTRARNAEPRGGLLEVVLLESRRYSSDERITDSSQAIAPLWEIHPE